ncbi:MAG: hypothetical protein J0L55_13090 [Caulobacterales bacterium]|nr:hypothetical protein [Caulobacterales bacterium]
MEKKLENQDEVDLIAEGVTSAKYFRQTILSPKTPNHALFLGGSFVFPLKIMLGNLLYCSAN